MKILFLLAHPGDKLGRPFQIFLKAGIEAAAEQMRRKPLPPLYSTNVRYQSEPWAGEGVEEFADPETVLARGWGDCDDLVIYRGAELLASGYPCHARILHQVETNKYHTQLTRDFDGLIEDPCLQRLGKPWQFRRR